jgi:hypothetical protein
VITTRLLLGYYPRLSERVAQSLAIVKLSSLLFKSLFFHNRLGDFTTRIERSQSQGRD